ncbi:serine hydrolase domain-containing protein [Marinactinospora rubrisoli]|uniref:Serine hydrolase domain-containing protein n=1 Tax=Marinactinospora rubrisoli TaxID=2715399 RepID=A0ABW2KAR9_9ACTN
MPPSRTHPPTARHRIAAAFLLVTVLLAPLPVPAAAASAPAGGTAEPGLARIDRYVRNHMAATGTPGLAYAIVDAGQEPHVAALGHDGNGAPVTADTPFLWGSVSKPVTATAVLALAEQGRLDLDQPVRDHLPDLDLGSGGDPVTVRDLLRHTSGLPASTTGAIGDVYGPRSADATPRLARLAEVTPVAPPGERHVYTSANYLILGALVEEVTGEPFAVHLRRAVLDPAGMTGALASAAEARDGGLPPGHRSFFGVTRAVPARVDDAGVAYGYLGGTVRDLAAFASVYLADGEGRNGRVLTPSSVRAATGDGVPIPGSANRYGLGWRIGVVGGTDVPMVFHGGSTPGHAAMLVLTPGSHRAVVVLQNRYQMMDDAQIQDVAFGIARLLSGVQPDAPSVPRGHLLVLLATATGAVTATAAVAWSGVRLLRRHRAMTRRRAAATAAAHLLAGSALAVAIPVYLSEAGGVRAALLWLPDVTALLLAAAACGAGLVLLGTIRAWRAWRAVR